MNEILAIISINYTEKVTSFFKRISNFLPLSCERNSNSQFAPWLSNNEVDSWSCGSPDKIVEDLMAADAIITFIEILRTRSWRPVGATLSLA
jgi:hypothetical protein